MASQNITTPKRSARATGKTTTKAASAAQRKGADGNGGKTADAGRVKNPRSEMTLEELSLRAYKMTYKRLHGSKNTKK
jgi:hypothetical protein